jgi:hypothetical protein
MAANATDSDGIAGVAFYQNGQLLGTDTTNPYTFSWTNVPAGSYSLTAIATDTLGLASTSAAVPVTVTQPVTRTNVALATNGGSAVASSSFSTGYAPAGVINGDRKGIAWGNGGGWNDGTANTWPDWLEVDFSGSKTIDEIDVFSVQDNYASPIDPTPSTTFTSYGLRDFEVQYWNGSAWVDVPGGAIRGQQPGMAASDLRRRFDDEDPCLCDGRVEQRGAALPKLRRTQRHRTTHQRWP